MPTDIHYLYRVPLAHLIGNCKAAAIVETPSAYTRDELETALAEVMARLVPFPAQYLQPWFWDTPSGLVVSLAQWTLYREEAMNSNQACYALFGQFNRKKLARLRSLVARRLLPVYYEPQPASPVQALDDRHNRRRHPYFRRSEVLAVIASGAHFSYRERRAMQHDR